MNVASDDYGINDHRHQTIIWPLILVVWFIVMNNKISKHHQHKEDFHFPRLATPNLGSYPLRFFPPSIYPDLSIRSRCGPVPDKYLCSSLLHHKVGRSFSWHIFFQIQSEQ